VAVGKRRKLYDRILSGRSDKNIPFGRTCTLLKSMGFQERVVGDHHIFAKEGVEELIDLQPTSEAKCKPYQGKLIRKVLVDYSIEP
jgi:hypothetical protein